MTRELLRYDTKIKNKKSTEPNPYSAPSARVINLTFVCTYSIPLDQAWLPAQPAHITLIKSLQPSRAIFWRLNVRILDWKRLLLYHEELDKYLYLIMLQNVQILFFRSCRLEHIWLPVVLCAYMYVPQWPHVPRGQTFSNFRRMQTI